MYCTDAFTLRTLLNHSKLTACKELLKIAHIKGLETRRIEQALILVYKRIYDQALIYVQEMFVLRSNSYSLQGHLKVVLRKPNSSYMQPSLIYQAGKQWNNLPDEMCSSRKYPYPHHGGNFTQGPPSSLEFPFFDY